MVFKFLPKPTNISYYGRLSDAATDKQGSKPKPVLFWPFCGWVLPPVSRWLVGSGKPNCKRAKIGRVWVWIPADKCPLKEDFSVSTFKATCRLHYRCHGDAIWLKVNNWRPSRVDLYGCNVMNRMFDVVWCPVKAVNCYHVDGKWTESGHTSTCLEKWL